MRAILATLIFAAATAGAATEGLDAVLARRKTMTPRERPAAQRMDNGALLSVYSDGSVTTQAVRLVKQPAAAVARVEALRDDQATLAAARALAKRVKAGKHAKDVAGLDDAELVAVADEVFDTSTKDKAAAGAIGAALAAAAARIKKGKPKDKPKKGV
jgi:hypothetical protein